MVDLEKKGRGVGKNDLYEVDGFEVEDMMGEIESVRVSEVVVPTEKLKEIVALAVAVAVAVLGMSMNVRMGRVGNM